MALGHSETAPEGSVLEFEIVYMQTKAVIERHADGRGMAKEPGKKTPTKIDQIRACVIEWLEYGALRGLGQWRNSGKGRFEFEIA